VSARFLRFTWRARGGVGAGGGDASARLGGRRRGGASQEDGIRRHPPSSLFASLDLNRPSWRDRSSLRPAAKHHPRGARGDVPTSSRYSHNAVPPSAQACCLCLPSRDGPLCHWAEELRLVTWLLGQLKSMAVNG